MKANKNELLWFITGLNPAVICLQETFLKHNNKINIRDYQQFSYIKDTGFRASGGTSILVRNDIPQSQIHLKTDLQTIAVKATLHRPINICSVYIPPNEEINETKLQEIIKQLPAPFIILRDFNCHSTLWGCKNTNQKGKNSETFINNNLCIYNNKSPTYFMPFLWQLFCNRLIPERSIYLHSLLLEGNEEHIWQWPFPNLWWKS